MFVRYYLELPLPKAAAADALLRSPQEWIPGFALDAERHGESLIGALDFGPVNKRLEIEVREPVQFPSRTLLPMTWRAPDGSKALFPVFEADIEVAALAADTTQLSISARYQPPLGTVGKAIDRALLHRVAETTVKDFLDRVGAELTALAGGASVVQR